jgi:very-short-patch-repair endonuclease
MVTLLINRQKINNEKLRIAKVFRKRMTFAERCFWNAARKNQINGLHFRRQQVIHGFIADFYCNELGLVVEVDGGIHELQKDYDSLRDYIMRQYGIKVMRFSNDDVVNHIDKVIQQILTVPALPASSE